jgi:hypothetical protein
MALTPRELRTSRNLCGGGGFFSTTKALVAGVNAVAVTGTAFAKVAALKADKLMAGAVIKAGVSVKDVIGVKSAVSAGAAEVSVADVAAVGLIKVELIKVGLAEPGTAATGVLEPRAVAGEATGVDGTSGPSPGSVAEAGNANSPSMAAAIANFTHVLPKAFTWSRVKVYSSPNHDFENIY